MAQGHGYQSTKQGGRELQCMVQRYSSLQRPPQVPPARQQWGDALCGGQNPPSVSALVLEVLIRFRKLLPGSRSYDVMM